MDRELSREFIRKRRSKIIALISIFLVLACTAFFALRRFITPSIKRSEISIATAETGTIEATISAAGVVLPEYQYLVTSPINAKLEQVLRNAGEPVMAGESILKLNKEATLMNYDRLQSEQQVNRNKAGQLRLSQERSLSELQTQLNIKKMRIQSLETALEHQRSLVKVGGGTEERVKQATLDLGIAGLELAQLQDQMSNLRKTIRADLQSIDLQIGIQDRTILETSRKLSLADVRSPARGIITTVASQVGSDVSEGAELARIADLSSFKVEGSIADAYASQLKSGGKVIIRINDTDIRGHITTIQPAVANGTVKFLISLDKKDHALLRSNLKVDVFIVTSVKYNVVRVPNGQVFSGSAEQKIFLVRGKEAIKVSLTTGESNFDFIEIRSGLKAGDNVIVTDLPGFTNTSKLALKD